MGLKQKITQIAQEAALGAVNYASSMVQTQLTAQTQKTGIMTVQSIDTSQNPTSINVVDGNGYVQTVGYLGQDYPYVGQNLFVDNGYVS